MAEFDAFRDTRTPQQLEPCYNCGRKFNPDTLVRHEKVCANLKPRKVFDSKKQRVEPEAMQVQRKSDETKPSSQKAGKANWRAKHENLIQTLKAARGAGPAPAPVVDPGYVECPYCNRNFNEHAAERHMPFCKEQQARVQKKSNPAKSKLNIRTQYKPPLPGSKKSNASPASEGGQMKQRTPNRVQASSSAGSVKQSPSAGSMKQSHAQSPGYRRRGNSDHSEQVDPRALHRKASPSPPSQRRNQSGTTKTLGSNSHRYQSNDTHNTQRASSGSSSDSDMCRVGSGHTGKDPSWFKDLKKTEDPSILPERQQQSNSAGSRGRHSGRHRDEPAKDIFNFDEKPIKPKRNTNMDDNDFPFSDSKPTTIGVVRPSSRKAAETEERVGSGRRKLANFCHECGTKYPVANAKFCCECGLRRMNIEV